MLTKNPGATSRTTGSATRWNSFTPAFMRQGAVQPLSVTTGLYGRPVVGCSGGAVSALVWMTGSGSAARAARLTEAAATAGHALPPLLAALAGAVLAIGVVIPGLSSSFLLVYLGLYKSILFAIAEIYIPTLFFAGVGFVIAAALLIFLMHYVLVRFHRISYFAKNEHGGLR